MATIDLSAGFMSGLPQRILRLGETTTSYAVIPVTSAYPLVGLLPNGSTGSDSYPGAWFGLMKGTVPTDFSTLTSLSSRSADTLVTFSGPNNDFSVSQSNVNPAVISTVYANATATGTVTWFWFVTKLWWSQTAVLIHQVIGTVGLTGSGADLEMGATSIVTGQPYRVLNLRILFPSTWTF